MGYGEFGQQGLEHRIAALARTFRYFENRTDIVLHRQSPEDGGFLWQISDPEAGTAVHGQIGDIAAIQIDIAVIGRNQTGDQIKTGRLAGPVRPQKTNHLAPLDSERHAAHDRPAFIVLSQIPDDQAAVVFSHQTGTAFAFAGTCPGNAAGLPDHEIAHIPRPRFIPSPIGIVLFFIVVRFDPKSGPIPGTSRHLDAAPRGRAVRAPETNLAVRRIVRLIFHRALLRAY